MKNLKRGIIAGIDSALLFISGYRGINRMGKAAREQQRLKELYGHLSDGELEAIALDWADLTDPARQEIKDEAERRGLILDVEASPPAPEDSDADPADTFPSGLVTLDVFASLGEAVIVKGLLESAGIESFLLDGFDNLLADQTANPVEFTSNGGFQVRVKAEDALAAKELLAQSLPEDPESIDD
jgi:hypothetical protein